MRKNERTKKLLSGLLALTMLVQNLPLAVFAAAEDGLCEHHSVHTPECHYAEAVEGAPCAHVHDEACGYVQAVEGHACHYDCAECAESEKAPSERGLSAELTGGENPSTAESLPQPPAAAAPSSEGATGAEEVCNCGTDDPSIHATTCPVYAAPEDPQCFCAEKCTEPNVWCDVCGFDYTACSGQDTAAVY